MDKRSAYSREEYVNREAVMSQVRFVEYDKTSGELIVNLPAGSSGLRRTIMRRINGFIQADRINRATLEDIERVVTHALLENSISVD
jgi:hypothetical protein